MSNKKFQKGEYVWDPSAWCEQCIAEAMRCIENLPEDFYDDKEPTEEYILQEEEYQEEKWRQEGAPWHWWSPDASWSQPW